jgi:hypothetical protein
MLVFHKTVFGSDLVQTHDDYHHKEWVESQHDERDFVRANSVRWRRISPLIQQGRLPTDSTYFFHWRMSTNVGLQTKGVIVQLTSIKRVTDE